MTRPHAARGTTTAPVALCNTAAVAGPRAHFDCGTMASALLFAAAVVVLAGSSMAAGTHWALLAAGSDGYWNYRHQADLCHAFQLLTKEGGIPASNVVTMFKDDVAYDAENPVKGELINRPGGPNVYEGVVKDYTGDTVNANNFLHVLKGDADAVKTIGSGRVVESGPEDTLFIAYFDHGATGLVGMPDGSYLYGSDLVDSLKDMYENGKFKRAVIFIEACESGSMVRMGSNRACLDGVGSTRSRLTEFSPPTSTCSWQQPPATRKAVTPTTSVRDQHWRLPMYVGGMLSDHVAYR